VTYRSADRLSDRATGAPYYLARVVIDPESLARAGDLALYPGMPAEVFFKTGERTALAYLIEPLTASLRRAFREP
jgi:multidrug efflux pump subunit AcrA (membrane-fusion protein)